MVLDQTQTNQGGLFNMQRYEQFAEIIQASQRKRRYSTLYYPRFERKTSDIYIITKLSDRMDLLAYQYYGDPRYWPIIAKANNLHNATIKPPVGIRLRIPYPLDNQEIEARFNEAQF